MICPVCGEPFDHRASSHQGPECDRCSEEKMSDNISREAAVAVLVNEIDGDDYENDAPLTRCIDRIRALPAAPAPQPTVPPEVKLALRVLLNHVEPGWDNCKTVVQLWLDSVPAPSDQCSGGMTCTHRAALKRCHELLQEAHAYVPENEAWHDQVTEILLPCDEAMECPTVPSVPAPQPWTEGELAKAMHAERLEREGCRSNYADERWDESKADRERWYASARVAMRMMGGGK